MQFRQTPVGFIPQVDAGYMIVVVQLPPGASLARTDAVQQRALDIALDVPGVGARRERGRLLRRDFHQRAECRRDLPDAQAVRRARQRSAPVGAGDSGRAQQPAVAESRKASSIAVLPPPVRGISNAGGFRMIIEDRAGRGPAALPRRCRRFMARAGTDAGHRTRLHAVRDLDAAGLSRHRPHQGAAARRQRAGRFQRAAGLYRLGLCQRLQSVRPHLPRHRAGAR